jgi:hypothetical protein
VFDPGTQVSLLSPLGGFPSGTVATVIERGTDFTCLIEFASGVRLRVQCDALGLPRVRDRA